MMIDLERLVRSIATRPLRQRRMMLRAAHKMMSWSNKNMNSGLSDILQRSLHVSRREAAKIDQELLFQDWLQAMEWLAVSQRPSAELEADEHCVTIEDEALFERLAATGQPVILAPMHMGVFSFAICVIAYRFFRDRKVLILRAREDRDTDTAAMQRMRELVPELRILNVRNKDEHMDALRYAREGALIICFSDLPESYGAPVDVELFGEPARLALGIDSLARITKGYILPMAVSSSTQGDHVMTGQAFEVIEASKDERIRVGRQISRQIQHFIYQDPASWHMWARIGEYRPSLVDEDMVDAA